MRRGRGAASPGRKSWGEPARKGRAFPQSRRRSRRVEESRLGRAEPFRKAGGGAGELRRAGSEGQSLSAKQAAEPESWGEPPRKGRAFPQSRRRSRRVEASRLGKAEPFCKAGGGAGELRRAGSERQSLSAKQGAEPDKMGARRSRTAWVCGRAGQDGCD
jgi:hypothetical protein